MAEIGQALTVPESGWSRYDDTDSRFLFYGATSVNIDSSCYGGSVKVLAQNASVTFKFIGTKIRLIGPSYHLNRSMNVRITLDGVSESFSQNGALIHQRLDYEKIDLEYGTHIVTVTVTDAGNYAFDAVDIDSDGYLMVQVGQALTTPESGWRRYDDSDIRIRYVGSWTVSTFAGNHKGAYRTGTGVGNKYRFRFYGTKFRLICYSRPTSTNNVSIVIDDTIPEVVSFAHPISTYQVVVYEKLNLQEAAHIVEVITNTSSEFLLDAIDIDADGYLAHPILNQVSSLDNTQIGDCIPCRYTATSNGVGIFTEFGTCLADNIPTTSSATPNGSLYFIFVGYDTQGRMKFVADRNIQHSISWDALNSAGIASGEGLNLDYDLSLPLFAGWKMDEVSGGIVYDVTGRYSGTCTGTTIVSENGKNFRRFNSGSDNNIVFSGTRIPNGRKTIRFRMRTSNINTMDNYPFASINNFATGNNGLTFGITSTTGELVFGFWNETGTAINCRASDRDYRDGQWHDIAIQWDGSITQDAVKLFVDDMDTPKATATSSVNDSGITYTHNIVIGMIPIHSGIAARRFIGDLSDIEIYSDIIDLKRTLKTNLYNTSVRLLTGGTSATDKDNEWDKIIVESSLGGVITPGDNSVWNWSSISSITSTRSTASNTTFVRRGGASSPNTVNGYFNSTAVTTSSAVISNGFRPILIVEILQTFRYLIQDGDFYKSIVEGVLVSKANITDTTEVKIEAFKYAPSDVNKFIPVLGQLENPDKKFKILRRKA